ncbi:hypothetical protein BS333_20825 (plasmid) [Vibrio azureus]|uniref:Histidine kinase/HSP90-like ATPase domain-containing protein n=2 Tax=Vibrio azureus TaxID=512649 RepID=U3C1B2_9VIBR|nr:hypothetical protein BS333_20825 [Vibrio azureus]GAD75289.1 hypothetical protein VAZ01S_023_00560 [Vibrio azureus NBRC 104587]
MFNNISTIVFKLILCGSFMLPSVLFMFYKVTLETLTMLFVFLSLIGYFGFKAFENHIINRTLKSVHVKVNAMNHTINEAIIYSSKKNEKISLADSLSIKESLYSIASISPFNHSPSMLYRSVEPLLSVTLSEYGTLANHYGIKFEYDFSADSQIKVIKLCPSTLNKVLSIVLSNAISVSGKGDRIRVMTKLSQSHYSVIVLDDGSGITPATLAKIEKRETLSCGRRVDIHNRVHYGLGLISLKRLANGRDISIQSDQVDSKHCVIINIDRRTGGKAD